MVDRVQPSTGPKAITRMLLIVAAALLVSPPAATAAKSRAWFAADTLVSAGPTPRAEIGVAGAAGQVLGLGVVGFGV